MTKEIRPLQRYNENTGQTEIFYPGTTTDAIAHPTKRKSLTNVISDIEASIADIETIAEGYVRVAGSSSPALSYKSYKYHEQGGFGRESVSEVRCSYYWWQS